MTHNLNYEKQLEKRIEFLEEELLSSVTKSQFQHLIREVDKWRTECTRTHNSLVAKGSKEVEHYRYFDRILQDILDRMVVARDGNE